MSYLNVEIKARSDNNEELREILKSQGAIYKGIDHQVDTYFKVNFGRLKLREGNIENYLIFYDREDKEGPKESKVILLQNNLNSTLKEILVKSLGALIVVDKEREIYFIDNVKFHLDKVEGLGEFMEIEAIDVDGTISKEKLLNQCNNFLDILKISKENLISKSYSDLLSKI